MDFKQKYHRSWNNYIKKLLLSKVFFAKVMKRHNYFFCDSAYIFIRQTLADDFWGYTKI